jgi:hypothetical protein
MAVRQYTYSDFCQLLIMYKVAVAAEFASFTFQGRGYKTSYAKEVLLDLEAQFLAKGYDRHVYLMGNV